MRRAALPAIMLLVLGAATAARAQEHLPPTTVKAGEYLARAGD